MKKTFVGVSTIAGMGLFAKEDLKAGEIFWVRDDKTLKSYTDEEHQSLLKIYGNGDDGSFLRFFYRKDNLWWLNLDDSRFINHSSTPNLAMSADDNSCIVLSDIPAGSELFTNYALLCENNALCGECGICKL